MAVRRYGEHPDQFAELTTPDADPCGVAVVVHGGFWKPEYGLEYTRAMVPGLVAAGWTVWVIEYRRGTGAADTFADVRAAIAARPDVAGPVVALGHSAGGHLATWAGGQELGLTHVISQAGVLDLGAAHAADLGSGAVERFLGGPPDASTDPIRQVPLEVPVWCIHARDDVDVPISQSRDYVAAARAAGGRADLVEVDGDHFTVVDPASQAWRLTLAHLAGISAER